MSHNRDGRPVPSWTWGDRHAERGAAKLLPDGERWMTAPLSEREARVQDLLRPLAVELAKLPAGPGPTVARIPVEAGARRGSSLSREQTDRYHSPTRTEF